jgi:hypothetical protein
MRLSCLARGLTRGISEALSSSHGAHQFLELRRGVSHRFESRRLDIVHPHGESSKCCNSPQSISEEHWPQTFHVRFYSGWYCSLQLPPL